MEKLLELLRKLSLLVVYIGTVLFVVGLYLNGLSPVFEHWLEYLILSPFLLAIILFGTRLVNWLFSHQDKSE